MCVCVHCLFTYIPRVERLDTTAAIGCCRTIGIPRGRRTAAAVHDVCIYIYGYRTIIIRSARYNKSPQPSTLPPPQPLRIILHMIIIICNIIYNNNMTYRFVGQWSDSKTIRESYAHASRMSYPRIIPGMRLRYSRCIVQCSPRYCLYGFIDDIIYIVVYCAALRKRKIAKNTHVIYIYIYT